MQKHDKHLSLRLPHELSDRIEKVRSLMASKNLGVEVERTKVVHLLLEKGLLSVESELGDKDGR